MVTLVNRAKVATATTGTGTITLGAAEDGYQTFADAGVTDGDVVRYVIEDGTDWEIGTGTYTASGTTLSRTVSESSNSDAAINLTGNAVVFITAVVADILQPDNNLSDLASASTARTNLGLGTIATQDSNNVSITGGSITGITDLAVADGGTGISTVPTNGQLLIGNGTNYTAATLTAGTGISVTNGSGTVTVAATNNGTVTSVGITAGNLIDVTGGPITGSGSITVNVDLSELTDMTATMVGTDEFVVLDAGSQRRKAANEIGLSIFNNDSGFSTTTGTVTSVSGTGNVNGITLTGTVTSSGSLTLGGTFSATVSEISDLTATAAELNKLDGVTATTTELNYVDISTLGTSQASKVVTADANGNVKLQEEIQAVAYLETIVALSGTTPTVDCDEGNSFTLTTSGNTTFTFSYAGINLTSNDSYGFTLRVTAGGTHTLTWPASVDWAGGSAPDAPASGETDVFVFYTTDGGTNWYGFQAGDAMA